jgi:hypothetical protein
LVTVTTNPNPLSIHKNGGSGTIDFSINPSGAVTLASTPASNLSVTGSGTSFTVESLNNTRGSFTLTFTTPCGSQNVTVTVVN